MIKIINYLFKKQNIINNNENIEQFFDNGTSFPRFIALIFNISEIPGVFKNPKAQLHKNINNNTALQYLLQKNQDIAKISPNYYTIRDKENLLQLILTKQCFKLNQQEIMTKCNSIVHQIGLHFEKKSDLINQKCILALLNVFTEGKVQIETDTNDFDKLMIRSFEKAQVPLVIDKSSFDIQNQFLFLIQIEIILEFFSDQIIKNPIQQNPTTQNELQNQQTKEKSAPQNSRNQTVQQKQHNQEKSAPQNPQDQTFQQQQQNKRKSSTQNQTVQQNHHDQQNKEKSSSQNPEKQNELRKQQNKEKSSSQNPTKQNELRKLQNKEKSAPQNPQDQTLQKKKKNKEKSAPQKQTVQQSQQDQQNKKNKEKPFTQNPQKQDIQQNKEKSSSQNRTLQQKQTSDQNQQLKEEDIPIIDVELDEDFDDSSDSNDISIPNNEEYKSSIYDELNNDVLLNTLNGIGREIYFHFDNILEAIKKENLLGIVKLFFKGDEMFTEKLNKTSGKIDEIIKILGTKQPIFNVLPFNFKDSKYAKHSAITFYTNLLNCFFLKQSRQKLFERCSTIIFSLTQKHDYFYNILKEIIKNRKNPYQERSILFIWNTYLALVYYVRKRSVHFKANNPPKNYFKKMKIPQIIDENYINHCNHREKDALFYQLQFIFNSLDNQDFSFRFHENILNSVKILRQIKVPKFETLVENIRVKNISFLMQKKRFVKFNEIKNEEEKQELSLCDLNMRKKTPPKNPETFNQRYLPKNEQKTANKRQSSFQTAEIFWNSIDDNDDYSVDDGILFMNKNKPDKEWINEISNYNSNVQINPNNNDSSNPLFSSIPTQNIKSKLYKFFHYDEKLLKWVIDLNSISSFCNEKKLNFPNLKIPLILFSNSNENESIAVNSKLINNIYPDLDDDNIYVYGLCDKNLALLGYNIQIKEEFSNIKPILLLLHVPKSKQKMKNIKSIILKIYYFLSIISDIEVVILNKHHYMDQIDLIKKINNIKHSHIVAAKLKPVKKEKEKNVEISKIQLNSDDFSSDGDDDFDLETGMNPSTKNIDINLNNLDLIIENNNCFKKETKFIFLVNDESIKGDIINMKESEFLSKIRKEINSSFMKIHYINVNDSLTYRCFLTSLNQFSFDVKNRINDVLNNFQLYHLTEISSMYINLKSETNLKSELKNVIERRFVQFEENNFDQSDDFNLLSKLNDEITKIYPSIDSIFYYECNVILNEIKDKISHENDDAFITELNTSSINNLNYLKEVINSEIYWTPEKKNSIEISHINFLRKEFYSIISKLYSRKDFARIFDSSLSILEYQICEDRKLIHDFFVDLENNYEKSEDKIVDLMDEMNERTNYSIRENEKEREIKVVVESGNLTDEIPQDF